MGVRLNYVARDSAEAVVIDIEVAGGAIVNVSSVAARTGAPV